MAGVPEYATVACVDGEDGGRQGFEFLWRELCEWHDNRCVCPKTGMLAINPIFQISYTHDSWNSGETP